MKIVATMKDRHDIDLIDRVNYLSDLGIEIFRFNFAKVKNEEEKIIFYNKIIELKKQNSNIKIMLDLPLPGKKNRIYAFNHTVLIEKGKKYPVTFNKNAVNEESEDFYLEEFDDDKNGKIVIYDAGQGAFYFNHERNISYLTALNSFKLYSGKSISVNIKKRLFYENELYRICNDFFQPDYFVLSFVDCVEDIFCLKDFRKKNPSIKIIPKIETEEGIINAKTIISESDGLMLGRGDLLLYSQMFNLYKYEKEISNICKYENKLCFFSTGYLDSMQNNYLPTRSEVLDLITTAKLEPNYLVLNLDLVLSEQIGKVIDLINLSYQKRNEI